FVEAYERRDLADQQGEPKRVGLRQPLTIDGQQFSSVAVAAGPIPEGRRDEELWLVPLQTPVMATGVSARSLAWLRERGAEHGLVPVQGGGATSRVAEEHQAVPLEAGGPLAISLIQGDFDLSGIGTVTHIEGQRVYGWGHPFLSLGSCDFPLMTGYIHTVY